MRRFTALLLVFFLLSLSGNMNAQGKKGAELIVSIRGGQQVAGELITIKKDALLLLSHEGANVGIDIDDISAITIVKKSKFWTGAGFGMLIGVALGVPVGIGIQEGHDTPVVGPVVGSGIIGGATGALIGGLIGASSGKDETIQIEGKSDSQIKEILERLLKIARVRDFQ